MAKAVAMVSLFGSQAQSIRARKFKATLGGYLATYLRPINVLPDMLDKSMPRLISPGEPHLRGSYHESMVQSA
jgi:hypothetical protein